MESYKKRLKWRLARGYALIVLFLIVMVVVGEVSGRWLLDSRGMSRLAQDASRILFFGGLIWTIVSIVRTKKLLGDRLKQEERALIEADERRQLIHDKSGALAMDIMLIVMGIAVFALAYLNSAAFNAVFALFALALVLKAGLYLYYKLKF